MKTIFGTCLLACAITCTAVAQQDPSKPVLREGKSVKMAVSTQAVEMRDADEENATVVTVTADGSLFIGTRPVPLSDLGKLNAPVIYVKADARVPYQTLLTLLDGLRGHSVALLTASPSKGETASIVPPYGVKVMLGRE